MKFNYCIGNPPYQSMTQGISKFAPSVFNDFMDAAYTVADKVELITPAKFLFNAGTTPKKWNQKMLDDEHFKVLSYYPNSSDVFPKPVDIKGGIAIHYRDANVDFGAIGNFSAFNEVNTILKKVKTDETNNLGTIINVCSKFDIDTLGTDYPQYAEHERRLSSNVLSFECFSDDKKNKDDIRVYGVLNNQRTSKYIDKKYIDTSFENISKYKVLLPKAEGSGQFGEIVTSPFVAPPNSAYTHTFYGIGCFLTSEEAENVVKYTKTKFARTLFSVLKITQNVNSDTWAKVPLQDFTPDSDIDWSQSISDIDKQLYKKYGLSEDEIKFIEKNVKEMK